MKIDFNQQKNDFELHSHKLQLNNEHLHSKCDQLEREVSGLKEMLDYEKRSKMMNEQKFYERENDYNRNNFSQRQESSYGRSNINN